MIEIDDFKWFIKWTVCLFIIGLFMLASAIYGSIYTHNIYSPITKSILLCRANNENVMIDTSNESLMIVSCLHKEIDNNA